MMIQVQYTDGRHDMVKPQLLDRLLDSRRLARFRRSGGWVTIGKDPVRRRRGPYGGPDRRGASA